ncbi:hypothetical protein H7S74_24825 [Priestia aryabhattai]|uniref:hypothetical protein n=1 Tax=Priestia aryabhattai TaxID=412384 RepID=UPI001EC5F0C1|nr:hypothetical protein [Priestia aryabhattai]MBY0094380.1 hypothetical protein [Priestia aryabhattai]MBY0104567.1 hypothetical protein [Priestia aryabhattai]
MGTWLIIELTVGLVWFLFWIILCRVKFWKLSFPFSFNTGVSIFLLILFPISWLLTIIVIESYLVIQEGNIQVTRLIIPLVLLIHLAIQFAYYKKNKAKADYIDKEISMKKEECIKWLKKCNIWDEKYLNIQIYEVKDKIFGKVVVRKVTEEQYICLKESEKSLPENTHLLILKD